MVTALVASVTGTRTAILMVSRMKRITAPMTSTPARRIMTRMVLVMPVTRMMTMMV